MTLPPTNIDWSRHALFLDFDGTLAPIVSHPDDVALTELARLILARALVATGGALAIVSGRGLADLKPHVPGVIPVLSGSHGAEFLGLTGETGLAGAALLDPARAEVRAFAELEGLLSENKAGSVSVHYRQSPEREQAVRALIDRLATTVGLRAIHGDMVSELALANVSKGTALTRIMSEPSFAGRVPIMIGDDVTDEDGFRAAQLLGGHGLRIGGTSSAADWRVADLAAMQNWLGASLGTDHAKNSSNPASLGPI